MPLRKLPLLVGLLLLVPGLALAASPTGSSPFKVLKPITIIQDRAAFARQLRVEGHRAKGGIAKAETDHEDGRSRSFPHFTSSFNVGGADYPFTMVGYPPASGRTAKIRSVIVPLRMSFVFFEKDATFEPDIAVNNILNSPLYQEASFPNGVGQFGDQLQRATFWNKMDRDHSWHVKMSKPRVTKTYDVLVEPDIGELFLSAPPSDPTSMVLGKLRFGAMDSTIHTILQSLELEPDEVPIFVTYNVYADALGYHDAYAVPGDDGTQTLRTLIYSSWLEPAAFGDLLADVSTFNHELGEWLNDPFVNNTVPTWTYPPYNAECSFNNALEVGDPQGNGPQFNLFPTIPVKLKDVTYHLQDLVLLPWFSDEIPSSAQNHWYDFPDTTQIKTPAVYCAP